jgi:hypothetical protein
VHLPLSLIMVMSCFDSQLMRCIGFRVRGATEYIGLQCCSTINCELQTSQTPDPGPRSTAQQHAVSLTLGGCYVCLLLVCLCVVCSRLMCGEHHPCVSRIHGRLPASLGSLSALQVLCLRDNALTGRCAAAQHSCGQRMEKCDCAQGCKDESAGLFDGLSAVNCIWSTMLLAMVMAGFVRCTAGQLCGSNSLISRAVLPAASVDSYPGSAHICTNALALCKHIIEGGMLALSCYFSCGSLTRL